MSEREVFNTRILKLAAKQLVGEMGHSKCYKDGRNIDEQIRLNKAFSLLVIESIKQGCL